MESDMMQPIPIDDATYTNEPFSNSKEPIFEQAPQETYYQSAREPFYHGGPILPPKDFLSSIDKNTWIILLVAFIIGFFMGKTMQPVIIRGA